MCMQFRLGLSLLVIPTFSESWTAPEIQEVRVVLILLADRVLQGE